MDKECYTKVEQSKPAVTLAGTAQDGQDGPPVGVVHVGISDDAYLLQVVLPGLGKNPGDLKLHIDRNGKVTIEGVLVYGEILKRSQKMYRMKVQKLCSPGPFSISFNLPGRIEPRLSSLTYRSDGILEVVALKYVFSRNSLYPGQLPRS